MSVELEPFNSGKTYFGLNAAGKVGSFDCGVADVNKYVAGSLRGAVKVGNCVAFALVDGAKLDANGNPFLVGFYTVSMSAIAGAPLKGKGQNIPPQVSCVKLGMLGVDNEYKKKGYGIRLMKHALDGAKRACQERGGRGMFLDADPGAVTFYLGLGFEPLDGPFTDKTTPMFLFKEAFF
jgi:predicted GNAT family N-acyltransferase